MGASLICLNYRLQNPQANPPSKWPNMDNLGLKMAIFDFLCHLSNVLMSFDLLLLVISKVRPSDAFSTPRVDQV